MKKKDKTHKTTSKRVRVTKNGKVLILHANTGHLKIKQSSRIKRRKGGTHEMAPGMKKRFKTLLTNNKGQ